MLITNHVVAGAIVGALVPRPATAFGIGVATHVAMDALPHWGDPDRAVFLRVAVLDGLVGLATLATLAHAAGPGRRGSVVAGMLGACAPDADKPADLFFGRSPFPAWVDTAHQRIQRESRGRMPQEVFTAVVGALVARRLVGRRT